MTLPSPQSLPEFTRMFPDDRACHQYFFKLRWPKDCVCPQCGTHNYSWSEARRMIQCSNGHQAYLTAGTIMHRSHTPLQTWFYGAFLATTLTPGISAVQFQKQLGLSRYETAFQILHKLRAAMVDPGRGLLRGTVEVDETFVGGAKPGAKGGRSTEHKTAVVGVVEVRKARVGGTYAGRLRLRAVPTTKGDVLTSFVKDHVERRSRISTDAWVSYGKLADDGYRHNAEVGAKLPIIHREFGNLKTWLQGTHHGRVERQHLQAYLNEFVFRHNRRFWRFSAFQTVLRLGMNQGPQEYDDLYKADEYGRNVHVAGVVEG